MTHKLRTDAETGCPVTEIAEALGLTCRRVHQMVLQGILPRSLCRGKYDLQKSIRAYSEYQRRELRQLRATKAKKKLFSWPQTSIEVSKEETDSRMAEFNKALQELSERLGTSRAGRRR